MSNNPFSRAPSLSVDEIALGGLLLDAHFGPLVARAGVSMMQLDTPVSMRELGLLVNDAKWELTGPSLQVKHKITVSELRSALVCLIQQQCVTTASKNAGPSGGKPLYTYRIVSENVFSRARFAHYLEYAVRQFGDLGVHVLGAILQHGAIRVDSISHTQRHHKADVEYMINQFREEGWIKPAELDSQQRKTMNLTDGDRNTAWCLNFKVLNLLLMKSVLSKIVEAHCGLTSAIVFRALFESVVKYTGKEFVCEPKIVKDLMENADLRRHTFTDTEIQTVLWGLHGDTSLGGLIMRSEKMIKEKELITAPPPPPVEAAPARKRMKTAAPKAVPKAKIGAQEDESYKKVEAFNIDWKAVRRKLSKDFGYIAVTQQFGLHTARIFALLDDNPDKMFEVDQMTDICLLTRKDVCGILNQLTLMSLVECQEIPKGGHSAQCTPQNVPNFGAGIWVYYSNRVKSAFHFRSLLAKSLVNVLTRFKDEVDGRAKMPHKVDRVMLDSGQDILERTFLHLTLTYLGLRGV